VVNVINTGAGAPTRARSRRRRRAPPDLAITKALSRKLGPDGVRVNAVMVGQVDSGQWCRRAEATGVGVDTIYAEMAKSIPLGRVGHAPEYADLVSYLLSPRASFVTGSAVNLDGGSSAAA
jgi:NAD(P)-dependent dehydrogenase (short-subunit alcohol dehydrogenase family)